MAVYPATSLATQTNDAILVTGGNIAGATISAAVILASVMTLPSGYSGTFTLNTTTPVTVSSAAILTTSAIILSPNTVAARTTTAVPAITAITAGQFVVTGAASDSSVMNWAIIKTV